MACLKVQRGALGDRVAQKGKKVSQKVSSLWRQWREYRNRGYIPDDGGVTKETVRDYEAEAAEMVSLYDGAGLLPCLTNWRRVAPEAGNLDAGADAEPWRQRSESFDSIQERDRIHNAFPDNDSALRSSSALSRSSTLLDAERGALLRLDPVDLASISAFSTRPQSPSPEGGHSRALVRQNQDEVDQWPLVDERPQTYAHRAWTPPDEKFNATEEEQRQKGNEFMRELVERCEEHARDGGFDQDVINSRFGRRYGGSTTPHEQISASVELREKVEAKANKRKLEFERLQEQRQAVAGPSRPRVVPKPNGYQLAFSPSASSLGDLVGEVMRRSGGSGFL